MPTIMAALGLGAAATTSQLITAALTVDTAPTIAQVNTFIDRIDVTSWSATKISALQEIQLFLGGNGNLAFIHMDRAFVALQLILRVNDHGVINQQTRSICGPAAFVTAIAKANPPEYARYVIDMAGNGRANLKSMAITPGRNILDENPAHSNIPQADYIALASLRSSTAYLGYDRTLTSEMLQGASIGSTIGQWMRDAGFTRVAVETSSGWSRFNRSPTQAGRTTQGRNSAQTGSLHDAITRARAGETVILCVSPNMAAVIMQGNVRLARNWDLTTGTGWGNFGTAAFTAHWILLEDAEIRDAIATSTVNGHLVAGPGVRFKISTWGRQSPNLANAVVIPYSKIASWYWGYVAGDPRGRP